MRKQIHGGDVYRHPGLIDFSSNINPLGTPPGVVLAAAESLKQIAHYPDVFCTSLCKALSNAEAIQEDYIICGNGAADLIFSLVQALKPQRALLPVPTFAEYEQALSTVSCNVEHYVMNEGFALDGGILEAITEQHDILFLCNPNNPTGFLIEPDFLRAIVKKCRDCKVFLVIDECFQDFIAEPEVYSMKELLPEYSNLFLLKAFTKCYAMAGIRLGYGLCSNIKLLEKMSYATQPWNVSIPAQAAGVAALQEGQYVKRARALIQEECTYLKTEMRKLALIVYDSRANYIFFKGPENLYEQCLKRGILIRDCENYPGLLKGFYRVAVRLHEENEKLIQELHEILETGRM